MTETEGLESSTEKTRVGFPESRPEKKSKFSIKPLIIFLLTLLLLGAGAWYLFGRQQSEETVEEATPTEFLVEETSTPEPTQEEADKKDISIQILNGSGIPGLAGKLQTSLKDLGYTNIDTANADNYSYKVTQVTFDTGVSETVKSEITTLLEKTYGSVDTNEKSLDKYDTVIIIGYPKGYTPSPTSKPQPLSSSPTPTSKVSGTVTTTKTPTLTPTPTI